MLIVADLIIGNLYWNKYPYDRYENEHYFDVENNRWTIFLAEDERMDTVFTYLGPIEHTHEDYILANGIDNWGVFLAGEKKYYVYKPDLCELNEQTWNELEEYRALDRSG